MAKYFFTDMIFTIPLQKFIYITATSSMAQWKRIGLITRRSEDRNLLLLNLFLQFFLATVWGWGYGGLGFLSGVALPPPTVEVKLSNISLGFCSHAFLLLLASKINFYYFCYSSIPGKCRNENYQLPMDLYILLPVWYNSRSTSIIHEALDSRLHIYPPRFFYHTTT